MKRLCIYSLFLLFLLIIIASCIHEYNIRELISPTYFTVDEAKEAFESQVEFFEVIPFTSNAKTRGKKVPVITPVWSKGHCFSEGSKDFVEVPLNVELSKVFAKKKNGEPIPDDEKYLNTDTRLCIQKGINDTYVFSLIYITGDFSYIVKKRNKLKKLSLEDLNGFSGQIRTFDLKGNLLWGYTYKEGKKIGHISSIDGTKDANNVQTRGWTTTCEDYDVDYEECYYSGYEDGEGEHWTDVECYYYTVTEAQCTDEWEDEIEDGCIYCGSPSCSGECQDSESSTDQDKALSDKVQNIKDKLDVAAKVQLGNRKFTIKEGKIDGLASGTTNGKLEDVLYKNIPTEIIISKDLTDIQLMLVIAHEYVHIILYEKSSTAGSATKLAEQNKELYDYIKAKNDAQEAHHEYMGKHPEIMEDILKGAFKGESDDFYNCGKWAGGGVHSEAFQELNQEEQRDIKDYLIENKL